MKYAILYSDNRVYLQKEVTERLNDGWELAGGISVTVEMLENERKGNTEYITTYYQAMVKKAGAGETA